MQFRHFKSKPRRSLRSRFPDLRVILKSNLLQQIVYVCAVGITLWLVCIKLYSEVRAAHLAPTAQQPAIHQQAGNFTFIDQQGNPDKPIEVWYYQPSTLPENAPIVFVMPGFERNARSYRDGWIAYAKRSQFLLVVPEFSLANYPTNYQYNYGNMIDKDTSKPIPENQWTFSAIEHLFDYIKDITENQSVQYRIYGHSAGGQFVQRMLLFKTNARIQKAIAANPGDYAMPDQTKFPYGLGTNLTPETLRTAFGKDFVLLLGDQDIKIDDPVLNKSPEAMQQGKNRFGRGLYFYNTVVQQDEALALQRENTFHWQLSVVHGVGHDETKMAAAAAKVILAPD